MTFLFTTATIIDNRLIRTMNSCCIVLITQYKLIADQFTGAVLDARYRPGDNVANVTIALERYGTCSCF